MKRKEMVFSVLVFAQFFVVCDKKTPIDCQFQLDIVIINQLQKQVVAEVYAVDCDTAKGTAFYGLFLLLLVNEINTMYL